MDRHQQIIYTLRRLAPILDDVCTTAQEQSAQLAGTTWADAVIQRTSLLRRLVGTARWGIATDALLNREEEIAACGLSCNTTYEQQNQGRFYWLAPELGVVFTVRREAHKKPDAVETLQLQFEGVLGKSAKSFPAGPLVAYLAVPPAGGMPTVDIVTRTGKLLETYTIRELLDEEPPAAPVVEITTPPRDPDGRQVRRVRSARKPETAEEDRAGDES